MKKIIITAAFLAFSGIALAQQDGQPDQDKIQQEPPRDTQQRVERAAQRDAVQKEAESQFQAEKRAKDKGMTQKQTTAERPVSDSVQPVKEPKPQVPHTPKPN